MIATDWATVDYYATLGVGVTATDEEIGRAFRALAKTLHPDRFGDDSEEAEQFKLVTRAYEVLSDPEQRRDYDRVDRTEMSLNGVRRRPQNPMGSIPVPPAPPMIRWTPRKAIAAVIVGMFCTVAGFFMVGFMIHLHVVESHESDGRALVKATVADSPSGVQVLLVPDQDGRTISVPLPAFENKGVVRSGSTISVWQRVGAPNDVIGDESHFGRDFTLWFVAVKFLFGGPIVTALGVRRRRNFRSP